MIRQKDYLIFIFTIILTSSFAQKQVNQFDNQGKRHGLWTKNYHNTDQIRYEGKFIHGKEVDTFKYYTLADGKSVLSALKVFNEKDSIAEVTFLASNKTKISEGRMNGKKYTGKWVFYHQNSDQEMIVENYNQNGTLEGKREVFYENGTVAEETYYNNGKLEGEAKWFSENGTMIKIAHFKDGEYHGNFKSYNNEGHLVIEGDYKSDRKHGIWHYYENGEEVKRINHTTNKVLFNKE